MVATSNRTILSPAVASRDLVDASPAAEVYPHEQSVVGLSIPLAISSTSNLNLSCNYSLPWKTACMRKAYLKNSLFKFSGFSND